MAPTIFDHFAAKTLREEQGFHLLTQDQQLGEEAE
jgi:hypothetical protein